MTIKIKGVIGYDVIGTEFADMLSKVKGDIDFEIDSPGGSVFDGISIFNAIKNYDKGKCRMHVVGDCSSMAAYIMLAGDGDVDFEPNSIVVLHNPWSISVGDYRDMQKEGKILEDMAAMYAKEFVKKGLFEEKEIRSIMDEETWFIGSEQLKRLGNVLEDDEPNDNDDKTEDIKIAALKERISDAKAKLKALKKSDDIEKVAALVSASHLAEPLKQVQGGVNSQVGNKINSYKAKITDISEKKGEEKMAKTLEELKSENPALYAQAVNAGIEAEKARVSALMSFIDVDEEATIDAVANGKTVQDDVFQAKVLMAKIKTNEIKAMEEQNPADINPKEETHAPEGEEDKPQDDKAAKAKAEKEQLDAIVAKMGI